LESDVQLSKDIANLGKITRDMQDQILTLRMVPVRQTFQKMIRLVRDLSRKQNKEVQLTLHGEDTEIDKTMVDELGDPLVHLMRNAIDHGIESPETRRAAGKESTGHIALRAFHRGGNIVIEIEDDGKGISKSAVVNKALEKGLIESSSNLTDQQIYSLIFLPGFSTAKQITDISGRGVGMDVVKKAIDKLRGKIEIESQEGKGSKISLSLPLTLAIIEGMVVQAGTQKYVLPLVSIVESHRPKKEDVFTVTGKGEMVTIRGELLPLARLHRLFDIPDAKTAPENALVIVIENRTKRCCLMVDDLLGQQQIVVKTLGDKLKNVKGVSAATILGDGKVGLILDVEAVMELAFA
jgi:two-component system chemotaxis sensor kinase CheA